MNAEPTLPATAGDQGPTIQVIGWPEKMPASDDTIRCAILTAEMRDARGRFEKGVAEIVVVAADGRILDVVRWDNGWTMSLSDDGKTISRIAARHGSRHDRPIPNSFFGRLLAGRERFSRQETEDIIKQFLASSGYPALAAWVRKKQH